jgi:transcriptional regulator with XRE-family HTH domain
MQKLANYLRSNRMRLGLSQDEVAFLLGAQSGAKISRYEKFTREPTLETAMAFETILQKPICEIFAGVHEKVERIVIERAKALSHKGRYKKVTQSNTRKLKALTNIVTKSQKNSKHP